MHNTEQEKFWAGEFGNEYIKRNSGTEFNDIALNQFKKSLSKAENIGSAIELGPNIGNNLKALKELYPKIDLHAVEINKNAVKILKENNLCTVYESSILDFKHSTTYDLSFTSGVLIHISPESLNLAFDQLYKLSHKYILIAEYYNHSPEEIPYRGHENKLFRRDFAGDFIKLHPDTKLIDYGFIYKNDPNIEIREDIFWFLIEKE